MQHLLMLAILKIKEIAEKLGLIADYVVEQDTITSASTTWHYKKWNSGYAEMKGYREGTVSAGEWVSWGSLYIAEIYGRNYPFVLTELYSSKTKTFDPTGTYMWFDGTAYSYATNPTTSVSGHSTIIRPTKPTSDTSICIFYEVYGKWK